LLRNKEIGRELRAEVLEALAVRGAMDGRRHLAEALMAKVTLGEVILPVEVDGRYHGGSLQFLSVCTYHAVVDLLFPARLDYGLED
jgi:hypothetical protein